MSLLDAVGQMLGGSAQDGPSAKGLLGMAQGLMQGQGGMSGLLKQLQDGGLGAEVQSWLGQGANANVSGEQLKSALGDERIANLAKQFGVDPDQAASKLSDFLPNLIDGLSPEGREPGEESVVEQLGGLAKRFLG